MAATFWRLVVIAAATILVTAAHEAFATPGSAKLQVAPQRNVETSRLCGAWEEASCGQELRGARLSMNGGRTSPKNPSLDVLMTLALILGASAAIGYVYPAGVEALGFRNQMREVILALFSACSILWFLSPSHWALRVSGRLRPQALRCSARGQTRLGAFLFAFESFSTYAVTAAQGFCAARLAVEALPHVAKRLLPFIPFNTSVLTSDKALKLMGPFLGPMASMAAWMMELMSVLIRHNVWQLLLVLSAIPASKFFFRALEPAPREPGSTRVADRFREVLRTALSSGSLFLGIWGTVHLGGRSLPPARWLSILCLTTLVTSQMVQDFLARAVIRIHRLKLDKKPLKGFVGGCLLHGQFTGFQGLSAKVQPVDSGTDTSLLVPAALALKMARSKGGPQSERCQVDVPAAGVMAGMEAAKKALNPVSKKAKVKKLLALPLAALLVAVAMKSPAFARFLYAFALAGYLSAYVLPPPLVVVFPLILLAFHGPINSASSLGMAFALAASCLKQLLQKPARGAEVACASLDLAQDKATIVWRGDASSAEEVGAKIQEAATDEKAKESLKKHHKKIRVKGMIFSLLSLVLLCGVAMWRPFIFSVEDAVPKVGARLLIFGLCSGLTLRLLQFGVIPHAARFALPPPLGALSAGPGKTVHWFLAVNARTAAASAAAAFFLPRVGLLQKIVYHTQMVQQVEWLDAWVFQISTAYLGCVFSVQLAKALTRWLSFRSTGPASPLLGLLTSVVKAVTFGTCGGLLTRCLLLAAAAPGPMAAAAGGAGLAVAVAAGVLAWPYFLAQDWLSRLSLQKSGGYWVRHPSGAVVPARLLEFQKHRAVLRPFQSDEAIAVPAAELKGANRHELRAVRINVPVPAGKAEDVESGLRLSLKQQAGLIEKPSLKPQLRVSDDRSSIQVTGFLERSAHPDQTREIRSALLLAAANAAN